MLTRDDTDYIKKEAAILKVKIDSLLLDGKVLSYCLDNDDIETLHVVLDRLRPKLRKLSELHMPALDRFEQTLPQAESVRARHPKKGK